MYKVVLMNKSEVGTASNLRTGTVRYWVSGASWDYIRREALREGLPIRQWIEMHYAEWGAGELVPDDEGLVALWQQRRAEGEGGPRDPVMFRAMYGGWGRIPHSIDLSAGCLRGLAMTAVHWGLPYRMNPPGAAGLASLVLEMVGRGWVKSNE